MKRVSTAFLRIVILLMGMLTLAGLIWFPQTEGVAKNLDLLSIYTDPFILFIYIGSIPFFIGLYESLQLLRFIDTNAAFSQGAVNSLKNMKIASMCLIGFIALVLIYIRFLAPVGVDDDPAGPTMLGIIVSFAVSIIATAAAIFQKLLQKAVDMKSENDLTV